MRTVLALIFSTLIVVIGFPALANSSVVGLMSQYYIVNNQTYLVADGVEQKLDIYVAKNTDGKPRPTVFYIHGGGWMGGSKEADSLHLMPYLEQGFNAVNVEYRLGTTALAPAAVEDVRCALRWVFQNGKHFGIDKTKIVVSGNSAGGHLALMTGMLPASAGLDRRCPTGNVQRGWPGSAAADEAEMPVAAIVNWYGITDVADLLSGSNARDYAVQWFGSQMNRDAIAQRVSPQTYVRKELPPVLTIHGDKDDIVPYSHAQVLHKKLDKAGANHQFYTVKGGGHGNFSEAENQKIFQEIWRFLNANTELMK